MVAVESISILIADDHPIVRRGLCDILQDVSDVKVVGEAGNGQQVLEMAEEHHPDVILLDISMPDRDGVDVLNELRRRKLSSAVLILSVHPEDQYALRVLRAGASGYLNKDENPDILIEAIRTVARGRKYITPSLAEKLAETLNQDHSAEPHEWLSDQEFRVLCLIARGKSPTQIADKLHISIKTVSTYRSRILSKTGFSTNAELTHYAISKKLVE